MSGVAVIRHLLATSDAVKTALGSGPPVATARIVAGDLPLNTVMPAIAITKVSGIPRVTLAMSEPKRLNTDRVQVSVLVKGTSSNPSGGGYPGLDALMKLLVRACPNQRGTINGVDVDSILPDVEGPDLQDDETGLHSRSRDFIVKWRDAT